MSEQFRVFESQVKAALEEADVAFSEKSKIWVVPLRRNACLDVYVDLPLPIQPPNPCDYRPVPAVKSRKTRTRYPLPSTNCQLEEAQIAARAVYAQASGDIKAGVDLTAADHNNIGCAIMWLSPTAKNPDAEKKKACSQFALALEKSSKDTKLSGPSKQQIQENAGRCTEQKSVCVTQDAVAWEIDDLITLASEGSERIQFDFTDFDLGLGRA